MILGLTGGIATGKSTVAKYFKQKGIPIICADEIAREATEDEEILNQISDFFGKEIIVEKRLDRKKLREIVFKDSESVEKLNSITHPYIISRIEEEIKKKIQYPILVVDIPLLFEGNYGFLVEKVLLVTCKKELQIERVKKRDSVSEENAINVIKMQIPLENKEKLADFIIENNGTENELIKKLERFLEEIKMP